MTNSIHLQSGGGGGLKIIINHVLIRTHDNTVYFLIIYDSLLTRIIQ